MLNAFCISAAAYSAALYVSGKFLHAASLLIRRFVDHVTTLCCICKLIRVWADLQSH